MREKKPVSLSVFSLVPSLSIRRSWGKGEKWKRKNLLSPSPVGRPDTQATSFQTFCLTVRAYLNTQKCELFCSLERQLTTARANQTTGMTKAWPIAEDSWAANWAPEVEFSLSVRFPVVKWRSRSVAKSAYWFSAWFALWCKSTLFDLF